MKGIVFRIGGEGGEGVISTGELLTLACARAGYDIYAYKTYPAEIKGGYAMWQVRVKDEILLSQGDKIDVMICFNQESYDRDIKDIADDGILLYDTDQCPTVKEDTKYKKYGIPFTKIAVEQVGSKLSKNVLILGVIAGMFDFPETILVEMIKQRWVHKGEKIVQKNIDALRCGMTYVRENLKIPLDLKITHLQTEPHMVLSGNEALALGSLIGGLKYYAGYPITPASDIMEWLSGELPKIGGTLVQCEDEIASLGSVLGASFAGKKAMTATSGPGLSLMCELVGLASMAEIPAVVVDVQRGGPSTGMPTKTEQADLNLALYGTHGDAPKVVMALSSVEDAFYGMIRAFNLAERTQGPVIVLSDQYLAQRKASVKIPDLSKIVLENRVQPDPQQTDKYKRYLVTESGVSPMAIPGIYPHGYVGTGIEHDETAKPGYTPALHTTNTQKRFRKIESVIKDSNDLVRYYGDPDPLVGVISWGSTEGIIRDVINTAVSKGMKVAAIHPKILLPLPHQKIAEFIGKVKEVIIPELNYEGQFATYLMAWHNFKPIRLNKYGGLPFTPHDILNKIEEVYAMTNAAYSMAK